MECADRDLGGSIGQARVRRELRTISYLQGRAVRDAGRAAKDNCLRILTSWSYIDGAVSADSMEDERQP